MTVKSKRELNRAVLIGGVFILVMTGVAFTVGALSNAYFSEHGPALSGRVIKEIDAEKGLGVLQIMKKNDAGVWADVPEKMAPVKLFGEAVDQAKVGDATVDIRQGRSISIVYAAGSADEIIPTYITSAMPKWFGLLFLLTLLSAAMSTLSSQFHTVGTSIGRDVYEQVTGQHGKSTNITRIGIILGIIYAVVISYYARESTFIARATAIFFGLCASAFLPALLGALYFRRMTKAGAIWSMVIGFIVTAFWLLLVKAKEAESMGIVQKITGGKTSLLSDCPNWDVVDPLLVALPISLVVAIVVSFLTKPPSKEHLDKCFQGVQ
jgi:SSS family solute:Na+ symporter